jgi:hypothetical protein
MTYANPGDKVAAVTASDATDLTGARALYIGGGGDVAVRCINSSGTTVTFTAVPGGSILPIRVTRVMAATTATNIVAIY